MACRRSQSALPPTSAPFKLVWSAFSAIPRQTSMYVDRRFLSKLVAFASVHPLFRPAARASFTTIAHDSDKQRTLSYLSSKFSCMPPGSVRPSCVNVGVEHAPFSTHRLSPKMSLFAVYTYSIPGDHSIFLQIRRRQHSFFYQFAGGTIVFFTNPPED